MSQPGAHVGRVGGVLVGVAAGDYSLPRVVALRPGVAVAAALPALPAVAAHARPLPPRWHRVADRTGDLHGIESDVHGNRLPMTLALSWGGTHAQQGEEEWPGVGQCPPPLLDINQYCEPSGSPFLKGTGARHGRLWQHPQVLLLTLR